MFIPSSSAALCQGTSFTKRSMPCYVKLVVCYEHFVVCNKESPQQRAKHELQSVRITEQHKSSKFLSVSQHACMLAPTAPHGPTRSVYLTWHGITYNPWLDSYGSKIFLFITYARLEKCLDQMLRW